MYRHNPFIALYFSTILADRSTPLWRWHFHAAIVVACGMSEVSYRNLTFLFEADTPCVFIFWRYYFSIIMRGSACWSVPDVYLCMHVSLWWLNDIQPYSSLPAIDFLINIYFISLKSLSVITYFPFLFLIMDHTKYFGWMY